MKPFYRAAHAALAVALACPAAALAQAYPDKPVRVIVAFPPGGSNDVVARIVFQKVSESLAQPFVIDNRGGAAGIIGASAVAKSAANGYTLMVHSATHIANPHLNKLDYDTLNDFIGVTPLAKQVFMLVVHRSMPVSSVKEFVALAKKRPGQILYGTGGNGTPLHLAMALLNSMTGTKMVHVQYKGGGPAVTSVVAGETQAITANVGVLLPHIKAQRVRPLGVTSAQRVRQFPDVPAIAETISGYDFAAWVGCFVPAGTPQAIVDRLNVELKKAISDPAIATKLIDQTFEPMHMAPAEFARLLKADFDRYGKLIRETATVKEN